MSASGAAKFGSSPTTGALPFSIRFVCYASKKHYAFGPTSLCPHLELCFLRCRYPWSASRAKIQSHHKRHPNILRLRPQPQRAAGHPKIGLQRLLKVQETRDCNGTITRWMRPRSRRGVMLSSCLSSTEFRSPRSCKHAARSNLLRSVSRGLWRPCSSWTFNRLPGIILGPPFDLFPTWLPLSQIEMDLSRRAF